MVEYIAESKCETNQIYMDGEATQKVQDPEMYNLVKQEKQRQMACIEQIASENFTSRAVLETLGSCLTNKYSEGYPGCRYYGGNEIIDKIETQCQQRAQEAYGLNSDEWGVNVQAQSGSPANFAVYTAQQQPNDRLMGQDLSCGGHLTHGFYTSKKNVSASSIYFTSLPYILDPTTELVDFVYLKKVALQFKPKLLICGGSAYSRDWDYEQFRDIANQVQCQLLCDMAHYSGLVASKVVKNPFDYCDVITTTTHKTLRGPRAALIFYRKKVPSNSSNITNKNNFRELLLQDIEKRINDAVFPACQGGPHNNAIAAIAVQQKEVKTKEFHEYSRMVVKNCSILCDFLKSNGYRILTGGSDTHLLIWDQRSTNINGTKFQCICDLVNITLNKNTIPGDTSSINPNGVRIGTAAMTTRGCMEHDFEMVGSFLIRALKIAKDVQNLLNEDTTIKKGTANERFKHLATTRFAESQLEQRSDITRWATPFFMPGLEI